MIAKNTTEQVRAASRATIAVIKEHSKQCVRKLAEITNGTKSSVHRHLQAKEQRNQHPESALWETEAGDAWLRLMVFSTLYHFGLKCGVGADNLSQYFEMIRIQTHVGVSPSALLGQMKKMELLLPKFQEECEKNVTKTLRQSVVTMDETFFGDFLILVLMDLRSGYLLLEEISDDRRYATWYEKTAPRLESLGIEVNHAISDRAKALIKLAITGFECESGADVFHAQQDVSRLLGATLARRTSTTKKEFEAAAEAEKNAIETATGYKEIAVIERSLDAEEDFNKAQQVQAEYHENLQGISEEIHPFSLNDNSIKDAEKVEKELEKRAQAFEKIAQEQEINDRRETMKKFRNQIKPLAITVSFWWLWVREALQGLAVNTELENWLTTILLPVVYWHHQMHKTQNNKTRKKYRKAWQQAIHAFNAHPFSLTLPESEIQHWLTWAESMSRQFHRSSSAVEGRNGCLAQMYHNGRGLSERRLKALTVIHNYGLKREDGTTAAMRFFETEFPDLFSWLLDEMGALPLPRKRRERVVRNPLKLINVPA